MYESLLPESIVWRSKQELYQGSNCANMLSAYFEEHIPDHELARHMRRTQESAARRNSNTYASFTEHFSADHAMETMGKGCPSKYL